MAQVVSHTNKYSQWETPITCLKPKNQYNEKYKNGVLNRKLLCCGYRSWHARTSFLRLVDLDALTQEYAISSTGLDQ